MNDDDRETLSRLKKNRKSKTKKKNKKKERERQHQEQMKRLKNILKRKDERESCSVATWE